MKKIVVLNFLDLLEHLLDFEFLGYCLVYLTFVVGLALDYEILDRFLVHQTLSGLDYFDLAPACFVLDFLEKMILVALGIDYWAYFADFDYIDLAFL